VMPPTVITELWPGLEQREIHQVLDVKGRHFEAVRGALPPWPHPDLAGTIKGSERLAVVEEPAGGGPSSGTPQTMEAAPSAMGRPPLPPMSVAVQPGETALTSTAESRSSTASVRVSAFNAALVTWYAGLPAPMSHLREEPDGCRAQLTSQEAGCGPNRSTRWWPRPARTASCSRTRPPGCSR
jgi:hypothetical protein